MRRIKFLPGYLAGVLPLLLLVYSANASDEMGAVRKMKAVRPYQEPVEVTKHRERIMKVYASQDAKLAKADKLCNDNKFKEAVALCEEVLAELELELASVKSYTASVRLESVKKKIAAVKGKWSRELLRTARLAAADKRYDDVIAIAVQASELSPLYRDEAGSLAEYGRSMKNLDKKQGDVSLSRTMPQLPDQQKNLKRLITEAKNYLRSDKLDLARNAIEKAFVINPYDVEAITVAGQIYRQLFLTASARRRSDVAGAIAYTTWQWAEPTFNYVPSERVPSGVKRTAGVESEKLKNIRFASFHFDDADLAAVLSYIQTRSKDGDPEKDEAYKGVTVGHMLTPDLVDQIRVTLSLDNVSLGSVLDCLCLVTGLRYEVTTRNGFTNINFAPQADDMISHSWDAPRNFRSVVTGKPPVSASESLGTGTTGGGGEGGDEGLLIVPAVGENASSNEEYDLTKGMGNVRQNVEISPEDLKNYFAARGVAFPPRSSIYYSPRTKKIIAVNTRENIFKLEERIDQIAGANRPLVMVEIKTIEISETDYQDLGFEWSIGGLSHNVGSNGGLKNDANQGWLLGPGVNTQPNGAIANVRGGTNKTDATAPVINKWNIFPTLFGSRSPFGSDIPFNISLTVNALSRSERTETLSAPKILARDSQRATIKMQTTYYFPEEWEPLEVEVVTSGDSTPVYQITPPVPDFSEDGESLGIAFTVVPTVRKNRDINLELDILLTSYVGPDNYEITVYGENRYYRAGTLVTESENYSHVVWRPIISQRSMKTYVDVSDGETLVLGGMVQNQAIIRVDKFPFLGDLPLIGRFFQSQAENMERANLLVFVTARLVDDHGMPIKRNRINALPDYNR